MPVRGESRYPFASLEVGDYFDWPRDGRLPGSNRDRVQNRLRFVITNRPALYGKKFKIILEGDVVRVTRTA